MNNHENDQDSPLIPAEPVPYTGVTPGQLLRKVREARGLSMAEVASSLRLRVSIIAALEADDYAPLKASTFVRGYFRSLAKLYDIDPQPLAAAYEAMGYGAPAVSTLKMQSFSRRKIREKNDGRLMLVSYLIIAAVIAAAAWWWWQQPATIATLLPSRSSIELQPRAPLPDPELAEQQSPQPVPELQQTQLQQTEPLSEAPQAAEQLVTSASAEGVSAAATESVTAQPQSQASAAAPVTSQDRLTMKFSQPCWVKVNDATGAEIAIGVKDTGYEMPLTGLAPFDIILCKPEALTMTLNGSAVDLSQYRRNRSVTLRLD